MSGELIRILSLLLVSSVICIILKVRNAEYSLLVAVSAGVVVGIIILKNISPVLESFKLSISSYGIKTEYFKVALKSVGIGYITSFIADSCRDCGQSSLASKAEFAGKCAIFILSAPLMLSVLDIAIGFVK